MLPGCLDRVVGGRGEFPSGSPTLTDVSLSGYVQISFQLLIFKLLLDSASVTWFSATHRYHLAVLAHVVVRS